MEQTAEYTSHQLDSLQRPIYYQKPYYSTVQDPQVQANVAQGVRYRQ